MNATAEEFFQRARANLDQAIRKLEYLIIIYEGSHLDNITKQARINALKGKIGVINSVQLNAEAFPWVEDEL